MFDSVQLGRPVPYATVLLLTGDLAPMGLSAEVVLESRSGFYTAIVACDGRRFELVLSQDDRVHELCRVPDYEREPVSAHFIPCCWYQHLDERPEAEHVEMAHAWGSNRQQECLSRPAAVHPDPKGDYLIAAAVAQGVFHKVSTEFVEACYERPELVDEVSFGEEAADVRHAMERKQLRLNGLAMSAFTRLRKVVGELCPCGSPLLPYPQGRCPPYRSAACAAEGER
ncbi:hypothetical protein ACI2LO_33270 [Streptomyces sp. NPDC033754]|uniref:hypothetical protein n=1 Tax=unclassified Streptomyces TaxID=2593676 RepID=UPI0033C8CAAB